jgi:ABC-type lipoprotein release transport system permease subunit
MGRQPVESFRLRCERATRHAALALLLALVAGAVPAWRAARLSIVDALAGR